MIWQLLEPSVDLLFLFFFFDDKYYYYALVTLPLTLFILNFLFDLATSRTKRCCYSFPVYVFFLCFIFFVLLLCKFFNTKSVLIYLFNPFGFYQFQNIFFFYLLEFILAIIGAILLLLLLYTFFLFIFLYKNNKSYVCMKNEYNI